jgi:hypothetical protein
MMRKNGVCEYTETCEYEANKIHIRLDSLRSEEKKVANTAHPTCGLLLRKEEFVDDVIRVEEMRS